MSEHEFTLYDLRVEVLAAERGIDTFDCADIYTGVEDAIGRFNAARAAPPVRVHTKYVPDYDELAALSKSRVEARVDRSLRRLRRERLDMLQFHWWNYDNVFDLERDKNGRHGRIMRYNLGAN